MVLPGGMWETLVTGAVDGKAGACRRGLFTLQESLGTVWVMLTLIVSVWELRMEQTQEMGLNVPSSQKSSERAHPNKSQLFLSFYFQIF